MAATRRRRRRRKGGSRRIEEERPSRRYVTRNATRRRNRLWGQTHKILSWPFLFHLSLCPTHIPAPLSFYPSPMSQYHDEPGRNLERFAALTSCTFQGDEFCVVPTYECMASSASDKSPVYLPFRACEMTVRPPCRWDAVCRAASARRVRLLPILGPFLQGRVLCCTLRACARRGFVGAPHLRCYLGKLVCPLVAPDVFVSWGLIDVNRVPGDSST